MRRTILQAAVLVFSERDNVGTALRELSPGDVFPVGETGKEVTVRDKVPFGFKVALMDLAQAADIVKYGEVIGRSTRPVRAGEMVHVHNIEGTRGRGDLERHGGEGE